MNYITLAVITFLTFYTQSYTKAMIPSQEISNCELDSLPTETNTSLIAANMEEFTPLQAPDPEKDAIRWQQIEIALNDAATKRKALIEHMKRSLEQEKVIMEEFNKKTLEIWETMLKEFFEYRQTKQTIIEENYGETLEQWMRLLEISEKEISMKWKTMLKAYNEKINEIWKSLIDSHNQKAIYEKNKLTVSYLRVGQILYNTYF